MFFVIELLIADRIEFLQHINKHIFLSFYIGFVCVSNKVHVYLSISSFFLRVLWPVERILFIELVEVFVTDLGLDLWNVAWRHFSDFVPIQTSKEWVSFDLIRSIAPKTCVCITD
jgi:hypothetical protein